MTEAAWDESGLSGVALFRDRGAVQRALGLRMKAASKRWTPHGAEAMANLIAERRSQDGRWEKRWPAQLPRPRALQPS